MLDNILRRQDVRRLLEEICTNNRYNQKDDSLSINYEQFPLFSYPLFMVVDAFYKYSVVVDDIFLLDGYINDINLLFRKINNFSDISIGINRLIGKYAALKLGYKNYEDAKVEVLQFIKNKYINEGYFFHAVSSNYVDDILENGFVPQKYVNYYDDFSRVTNILPDIIDKDFSSEGVYFTDSFIMAYYYAITSPLYFNQLLVDNKFIKKDANQSAYFRCDYDNCLKNLNKIIMEYEVSNSDADYLRLIFNKEWNLLKKEESYPVIMMVKRNLFLNDQEFNLIIDDNSNFDDIVSQIFTNRYNNFICDKKIDANDLKIIKLFGYKDFVFSEEIKEKNDDVDSEDVLDKYGKVTAFMLFGSLLITLGVIFTFIMVMR